MHNTKKSSDVTGKGNVDGRGIQYVTKYIDTSNVLTVAWKAE